MPRSPSRTLGGLQLQHDADEALGEGVVDVAGQALALGQPPRLPLRGGQPEHDPAVAAARLPVQQGQRRGHGEHAVQQRRPDPGRLLPGVVAALARFAHPWRLPSS
jgi:hypothetical protein